MQKIVVGFLMVVLLMSATPPKKMKIWLCGDSTIAIKQTSAYPEQDGACPLCIFGTQQYKSII